MSPNLVSCVPTWVKLGPSLTGSLVDYEPILMDSELMLVDSVRSLAEFTDIRLNSVVSRAEFWPRIWWTLTQPRSNSAQVRWIPSRVWPGLADVAPYLGTSSQHVHQSRPVFGPIPKSSTKVRAPGEFDRRWPGAGKARPVQSEEWLLSRNATRATCRPPQFRQRPGCAALKGIAQCGVRLAKSCSAICCHHATTSMGT